MFKAILWDNDGVLVETEKWYFEATKIIMSEEGFNLTLDIYRETFLKNNTGAWHLLKISDKKYIKNLRNKRNNLYSSFLKEKDIYIPEVSKILQELSRTYKMGIVTSSRKDHFDMIHSNSNILQYFDFIITSDDFTQSKPNPEPYLLGIQRTGYKAYQCIAIEDSERGVIAAKNANLFCFAIPNKLTCKSDFSKADKILKNINEILEFLD